MSNVQNSTALVGVGQMGVAYAKVFQDQKRPLYPIGRGKESAATFERETGMKVNLHPIKDTPKDINRAIVAASVLQLPRITQELMDHGIKHILVEKPCAITVEETQKLHEKAQQMGVSITIAYNRRYYASVMKARHIIEAEGGVQSFNFDFTEWSDRIAPIPHPPEVKAAWLIANSSHVIDLAFHLGGSPDQWTSYRRGTLDWHPHGSRFSGAGVTKNGALFSYQADWDAPGRWGVDIMTKNLRLILCPLEGLKVWERCTVEIKDIALEDDLDKRFKPGLYRQVEAFLSDDTEHACQLTDHLKHMETIYSRI